MNTLSRMLILTGVVCLLLGTLIWFLGRVPGLGRLPGDITIKKANFSFYFPLGTSILLSLILSVLFFLFQRK